MMGLAAQCESHKTTLPIDDVAAIREGYMCSFSQGGTPADSDGDGLGQDVDCDDQDPASFPGATEICDLRDNDCNGLADAADGLDCSAVCLVAEGGPADLRVEKGACTSASIPGYRNVFVRGSLNALRAAGGVSSVGVELVACPQPWTYDRVAEASALAGDDGFYLVRDVADTDFGADSAAAPRVPTESGCP
ncbi:MAG: hypothetical protein GY716_06095 [bacterium]|nr:hypothetical protein [bacterium]